MVKKSVVLFLTISSWALSLPGRVVADQGKDGPWPQDIRYLVHRLEVQHPNLYANVEKEVFQTAARDLISRTPDMSERQIVFAIQKLTAMIRDVHCSVPFWKWKNSDEKGYFDMIPLTFHTFDDGLFIMAAEAEYADLVGARVLAIGNTPTEEVQKRLGSLMSADNPSGCAWARDIYLSLFGALEFCDIVHNADHVTLKVQEHGRKPRNIRVRGSSLKAAIGLQAASQMGYRGKGGRCMLDLCSGPAPLYLSRPNEAYWYQYIPEHKTMYVCLLKMEPKTPGDFERFYRELLKEFDIKGAEKLVLDIRNNGGGDHYEKPLLKGVIARTDLDRHDRLFVIIGRGTVSASQHFATQFRMYTNATFIGENTGGRPNHYGAQRFFELPNSHLPVRTSIVYHQDETDWEMADCTRPDFYTFLSSTDFLKSRDPSLELIFDFERVKHLRSLFRERLSKAYLSGGYLAIESAYRLFFDAFADTGISRGMLINDFMCWLSANKKTREDYTHLLELYTLECPDWSESWFALARAMELSGNGQPAEDNYLRCLEVFPGNVLARRNLALLRFIRQNG